MSVYITHYLGIGYKLDYHENEEKIDAFLDKHPEYSKYEFENPNANKPGLQIIMDGMNGTYIYIMYVLNKTEVNGYHYTCRLGELEEYEKKVEDLYYSIFGEYALISPYLVSFFHYT